MLQNKIKIYKQKKAHTSLTNNEDDYELEENINLPIKEESDSINEDKNNDNDIKI